MSDDKRTAMTDTPRLSWDEAASRVPVDTEDELMERLRDIARTAAEAPPLVELLMADGSSLAIGVGREQSVVNYIRSPDEPDYLSKGSEAAQEPPVFYYHGTYSDFPPDAAVSAEDAYEAMRRFYRSGERPDNIQWQQ